LSKLKEYNLKNYAKNIIMDVVCRKYSCKFNEKAKCNRKNLQVNEKSDCDDLVVLNEKLVEDVSKDMFCHEPDIAPYHHCRNMNIKCSTENCVFNKCGECFSNGVFIGSMTTKAPCNSYVPK
jgi:hypothetical protein